MSSSSSTGNERKSIRQLIRDLNTRFEEISKFNDRLVAMEQAFERVEGKVTALEQEMGQVEECLVRLVSDHNELVKLLQPPELQRYPADLMPREVRTDGEGKVVESKIATGASEAAVVDGLRAAENLGNDSGAERGAGTLGLDTIDEEREAQERAVHTLTSEVPEPRPVSPSPSIEEDMCTRGLVFVNENEKDD